MGHWQPILALAAMLIGVVFYIVVYGLSLGAIKSNPPYHKPNQEVKTCDPSREFE